MQRWQNRLQPGRTQPAAPPSLVGSRCLKGGWCLATALHYSTRTGHDTLSRTRCCGPGSSSPAWLCLPSQWPRHAPSPLIHHHCCGLAACWVRGPDGTCGSAGTWAITAQSHLRPQARPRPTAPLPRHSERSCASSVPVPRHVPSPLPRPHVPPHLSPCLEPGEPLRVPVSFPTLQPAPTTPQHQRWGSTCGGAAAGAPTSGWW